MIAYRSVVSFSDRLPAAWRWLGLEGVVLVAALVCDLLVVVPAAFDDIGPRGRDLLLLPGILGSLGSALWARHHPARGAFAGAAALVASTVLIRLTDTSAYSLLLTGISLTETVAGVEIVYFAVRRLRPAMAFATTASLVVAGLFAVLGRAVSGGSAGFERTLFVGFVLLIAGVGAGMRFRLADASKRPTPAAELLRNQWPLIGGLCLPLFLDLYDLLNRGLRLTPLLLCSAVAAVAAVYASRKAVASALVYVGVVLATGPAFLLAPRSYEPLFSTLPTTEIAAGLVIVVFLVRLAKAGQALLLIGAMAATVGLVVTANALRHHNRTDVRSEAIAAVLLLGMAVAVGLYFRARDSERAKVVEAAVTEAQTSERMALARELHDVVAHHVTGIVVQAQAARMTGEANPAVALESLGNIEKAGTDALVAMRRLVRSMRTTDQNEQATTDLVADLRQLADSANHSVPTEFSVDVPPDLPHEVARSALRLVQESLTNVGKHAAHATQVRVLVALEHSELHIRVADDGDGAMVRPAGGSGGYGLVGMRERVELLHGRFTAGPADGGWVVEAWLPLEGEAE